MSRIIVTPLSQLATQLSLHRPSHVVTLGSRAPAALPDGYDALRLSLTFNDIIELREGLVAPDETHVLRLVDFAMSWSMDAPLLIHCYAGISRSTAAAYIIASALNPAPDESELAGFSSQPVTICDAEYPADITRRQNFGAKRTNGCRRTCSRARSGSLRR